MRKQLHLVPAESHKVPEANCDVSHPSGFARNDRTATQHEARHIN
jgi:hypothetical protein